MNDWVREIYETHRRLLFRVAWLVLRRGDLAEDAVQTAFSRIVRLSPDVNGNAKSYALKAVRNAAIDLLRQTARNSASTIDAWEQIPGAESLPRRQADTVDAVYEALENLDAATQEIIHLHIHEQLTFREIGELIDIPTQTAASRYRRGLKQIQTKVRSDDRLD